MSERYKNREIDKMFAHITKELVEIKNQTTKTNGRLRVLEKALWVCIGAIGILSYFVANNLVTFP